MTAESSDPSDAPPPPPSALVLWKYKNPHLDPKRPIISLPFGDHQGEYDGAYILSRLVFTHFDLHKKRVLDLSAGTGLLGIVASFKGAREVVFTDIEEQLKVLKEEVERNLGKVCDRPGVRVEALEWANDSHIDKLAVAAEGFDLILASEVLYLSHLHPQLLQTLKKLSQIRIAYLNTIQHQDAKRSLRGEMTKVYMSYKKRGLGEEKFWELVQQEGGWEVEEVNRDLIDEEFRDEKEYAVIRMQYIK
ncbi:Methyltransferase-like protein 21A [Chytridiales sp. JEL 0842]|nr:Methyltransferase-like protein 21A [Chytridiales sp. JEL 0842]